MSGVVAYNNLLWEQRVAGSNPAAPTIDFKHFIIPSFGSRNEMRNELMAAVLGLRGLRAIGD